MRYLLILFLAAVLLAGCDPCKRLARRCPLPTEDSVMIVERVTIDSVMVPIPGDTAVVEVPLVGEDGVWIATETQRQRIVVRIRRDTVRVESVCKEDSLQTVIEQKDTELRQQKTIVRTVEVEREVTYTPRWAWITLVMVLCGVAGLGVYVYTRIRRKGVRDALNELKRLVKG